MQRGSIVFLKVVILLIAIVVFVCLIWFPLTEGRAVNLALISIYTDPFIIYIYISSIPFFVVLYQAFTLLNLIDDGKAFSHGAVDTLKTIKLASLSLVGCIVLAELYLGFFVYSDDGEGPRMLGLCMIFALVVFATTVDVFQKLFQNAIDLRRR